jgi:hypothetical protein
LAVVDAAVIHGEGGRLLVALGADETGPAQAAEGSDVAISLAVVEERVAEEDHLPQRLPGAAQFLNLVQEPGGGFGIVRILLAGNLIGAQFHVQVGGAQSRQPLIHRFKVAVDDHVTRKIRQASPAKLGVIGNLRRTGDNTGGRRHWLYSSRTTPGHGHGARLGADHALLFTWRAEIPHPPGTDACLKARAMPAQLCKHNALFDNSTLSATNLPEFQTPIRYSPARQAVRR